MGRFQEFRVGGLHPDTGQIHRRGHQAVPARMPALNAQAVPGALPQGHQVGGRSTSSSSSSPNRWAWRGSPRTLYVPDPPPPPLRCPRAWIARQGRCSERSTAVDTYIRPADAWTDNPLRHVGL